MDLGDSINPTIDIGQIEGAFIQGMGLFTMEELVRGDNDHPWVKKGLTHTRGPGAYKIPSSNDIPVDFRVHLVKDVPNHIAIMRSKAVGEPPLFLGSSVFFAIKDALLSARKDNGIEGILAVDSPLTCERIRMATGDKLSKMITPDYTRYRAFQSN
jgi:xanthine dehydrogenase/oxidase